MVTKKIKNALQQQQSAETGAVFVNTTLSEKYPLSSRAHKPEPCANVAEIEQVTAQFLRATKQDPLVVHAYEVKLVSKVSW